MPQPSHVAWTSCSRRDGPLSVERDALDGAVTLGATDDEHLDRLIDRLKREFAVTGAVSRPRVDVRRELVDLPSGRVWMDVEPWMDVQIRTTPWYVQRLVEAFPALAMEAVRDGIKPDVLLVGRFPLAAILGLKATVQGLTHGKADVTLTFAGYAPVPPRDPGPGVGVRSA